LIENGTVKCELTNSVFCSSEISTPNKWFGFEV
jgi:hypothetical protein